MRAQRIDYAYYAKRASGVAVSTASAESLWEVISSIGGENRYYYLNALWAIREWMDWLVGGPGLKRGRRHPTDVRVGDRVDSWEVIGVEPQRRLTLRFGMRAPGAGVLELEMTPTSPGHHRVTATAYWHPAGLAGLLYWYAMEPAHQMIFGGLTREVCQRANALDARRQRSN
jgi:hypothetical protein